MKRKDKKTFLFLSNNKPKLLQMWLKAVRVHLTLELWSTWFLLWCHIDHTYKGLWNHCLWLKRATEAGTWQVKPWMEALRGQSVNLWKWSLDSDRRAQDIRWAKAVCYLPWRIGTTQELEPAWKRDVYCSKSCEEKSHISPLNSEISLRIWSLSCWVSVLL